MSDFFDPAFLKALESLSEGQLLVTVGYGEACSEPIEGLVAVLCSARNRVQSGRYGEGWKGVLLKPWQYSCLSAKGGQRNYERVVAFVDRLLRKEPLSGFDEKEKQCFGLAHLVLTNMVLDNTQHSTHYHSVSLVPRPAWAQSRVPKVQKASHLFYAGVP